MSNPLIPPGYRRFKDVILFLMTTGEKLVFTEPRFTLLQQDYEASQAKEEEWSEGWFRSYGRYEASLKSLLGDLLSSGIVRAIGQDLSTGYLFSIPSEYWRSVQYFRLKGAEVQLSTFQAAWDDLTLEIAHPEGRTRCLALVGEYDLALALDAKELPPEPLVRPEPDRPNDDARRRGRPPTHDWDAFWIELACVAATDGLEESSRPQLRKHMIDWCDRKSKEGPDDTTVDKKLTALYRAARARRNTKG